MCLSHDIWHQIIQYFEHQANDADAPSKRNTLLNLAAVSRSLSSLALATLWRDMDSLQPIVGVINYFTPAQEKPLLAWFNNSDNGKYWEFPRKSNEDRLDLRVKEYLGRIRAFHTSAKKESERALWPILIAWFWKNKPLLPKLQKLSVDFNEEFPDPFQYLAFMVPPKLEHIVMADMESFGHTMTFYQLLLSQGCSPAFVEYCGDVALPHSITLLTNLHTLVVWGPYKHARHNSPFSLPELLNQLPSLKYLDIGLETLRIQASAPLDPFQHLALETVLLQGTTEELQPLLPFAIVCPSVKDFSLEVRWNTNLTWRFLLQQVIAIFPNLKDLTLQVPDSANAPQLVSSDLHKLLSQSMESLFMEDIPNKLSQRDLQHMFSVWPNLHTFALTGGTIPFHAETLLPTLTYQNLHTLHLPLDFIPLASTLICPLATQKNPLRELWVAEPTKFPSVLKEKVALAQNLLILLPELRSVKTADGELTGETTDLQIIIKGMQAVAMARSG